MGKRSAGQVAATHESRSRPGRVSFGRPSPTRSVDTPGPTRSPDAPSPAAESTALAGLPAPTRGAFMGTNAGTGPLTPTAPHNVPT